MNNENDNTDGQKRGRRKVRTGTVVSDGANKTVVVEVSRTAPHPIYRKVVKMRKKFAVHDEKNEAKVGDVVKIMETRPVSKTKCWRLLEIISRKETEQIEVEA